MSNKLDDFQYSDFVVALPDREKGECYFNANNSEIAEEARFPSKDIYDCITNKCYNVRPYDIDAYGDVIILVSKKKGDPDEVLKDIGSLSVKCLTAHHKKNLAIYLTNIAMGYPKSLTNRTLKKIDEVRNSLIQEGQERYASRDINLIYDTQFVMRFLGISEVPKRGMVFILRRRISKTLDFKSYIRNDTISISQYADRIHYKSYYKFDKRSAHKGFLGHQLRVWIESNYMAALSAGIERNAQDVVSQTINMMDRTVLSPIDIFGAVANGEKSKTEFLIAAARLDIKARENEDIALAQRYAWLYHVISNSAHNAEKIHSVIGDKAEEAYRGFNITKNRYVLSHIEGMTQKECLIADAEAMHFVMLNFEDDVCVPCVYLKDIDNRNIFGYGQTEGIIERFSTKDLFENPRCVRFSKNNLIGIDKRWEEGYNGPKFSYYKLDNQDEKERAMRGLWLQNTRFQEAYRAGVVKDLVLYLWWGVFVTSEQTAGEHELASRLDYMYSLYKFLYFGEIEKCGMTYKNFKRFIRQEKDRSFSDILVSKMKKAGVELRDEEYVRKKVEQIIVEQCFLSLARDNCNPSDVKRALTNSVQGLPNFFYHTRTRLGKDGVAYAVGGLRNTQYLAFYSEGIRTMCGKNKGCCDEISASFAGRMLDAIYHTHLSPSRSSIVSWIRGAIMTGFFPIYDGNRAFWFDGIKGEVTNILYERAKVSE